MLVFSTIIFAFSLFSFSDALYYLKNQQKCSITDEECLKSLRLNFINNESGVLDASLASLNPLQLKGISVTVLDIIKGTLETGKLDGILDCVYQKFTIDLEKKTTHQKITCDALSIEGDIKLTGANELLESIFGIFSLDTKGKGSMKIDKLLFEIDSPFIVFKKNDGEVYWKMPEKVNYTYSIENAQFFAEDFIVAGNDISDIGVLYVNTNWKSIMKNYGSLYIDEAVGIYVNILNSFYSAVPTKNYIIEDLSPYAETQS